jgi:hypothetical protein
MTIQFACPTCGRNIRVRDEAAGHKGTCQDCGSVISVPAAPIGGQRVESSSSNPQKARSGRSAAASAVTQDDSTGDDSTSDDSVDAPMGEVARGAKGKSSAVVPAKAKKEKSNNWARAAFGTAVVGLLVSWIAAINYIATGVVTIALGLTILAFVLSFRRQGNGRNLTIASAVIACVAIPVIVITTQMEKERQQLVASIRAQADAIGAFRDRQFSTKPPTASQAGANSTGTTQANIAGPAANANGSETSQSAATQSSASGASATESADSTPATANGSSANSPKRPQTVIVVIPPGNTGSPATSPPVTKRLDGVTSKRVQKTLDQGRRLVKTKNIRGAERAFRRVIDAAPGTSLAAEAQQELDALHGR